MAEKESIMFLKRGGNMEKGMAIAKSTEHTVTVENINFRLLINEPCQETDDEDECILYDLHSHISAEIFACGSGEITLSTKNKNVTLNGGDIAVVPPGVLHCMLSEGENAEKTVINFICNKRADKNARDLYADFLPFIDSKSIWIYRGRHDACACVSEIERLGKSRSKVLPALKAVGLLIDILDNPDEKYLDTAEGKNTNGNYDIQRMMELDCLIGNSYMEGLTMKEIADKLYISSRQLDRIVQKRYGKTLHKVVMEKRMSVAEQLLLTTDMTVEEIGSAVGFSSSAGFYREFLRAYGVTPAVYKKSRLPQKSL